MEKHIVVKNKKMNNQRIAQSFGCMEVDKILYIKTLSTMNITKLTFLLRRKLRNSLIFRNFTILSAAIILFPFGSVCPRRKCVHSYQKWHGKNFHETSRTANEIYFCIPESCS